MIVAITDELRLFAADPYTGWVPTDKQQADLRAIADRIDAEHERALRESYDNGYASADDWIAQHEDAMAEHGWIRLPLDADGVPIRVGDRLDGYGKTIEVVELRHGRSGWVLISRDGNAYADTFAFTHHHAPTVEDVLREFADEVQRCCDTQDTIAEYAKRLRLAEEVDE